MTDTWKERALIKKKYRRGGIEPDPPRKGYNRSRKKQFVLQHYTRKWNYRQFLLDDKWIWECPEEYEWSNWKKFTTFKDAVKSGEDNSTRGLYKENPWRIIDLKTGKIVWEVEGIK